MTLEEFRAPLISFPKSFVSSWLPAPVSVGSGSKAFQSNFPQVSANRKVPIQIDPSGADVIVLNPGSRYLKLGLANQAFPALIPHCLAKPSHRPQFTSNDPREDWQLDEDELDERLTQRYKQSRKKPPPNIYQSLSNYNRQVEYTEISAHNDAFLAEWLEVEQGKVYVGNDALRLNPELPYQLLWPLQRGTFNSRDYQHTRQVVSDLSLLWRLAIECELKIEASQFGKFCLVLVAPDSWDRAEIKACVEALQSTQHPFRAVTVLQESQAITFGSGVSSALVVNCGAQSVSFACVDEGYLVPESRIKLSFGGDEVTRLFARLLEAHEFPYEFDLRKPADWALLDELKERCGTLNEAELGQSAQVFELYVRHPEHLTRQFLFKMYEERLMAPLAMFESGAPWLLEQGCFEGEGISVDAFDCEDPFTGVVEDVAAEVTETAKSEEETKPNNSAQVACKWNGCKASFEDLKAAIEHLEAEHDLSAGPCSFPKCKFAGKGISLLCHIVDAHFKTETVVTKEAEPVFNLTKRIGKVEATPFSVDEAAFQSLLQLADSERIKRCASSIILAGGSQLTTGFPEIFLNLLAPKFPLNPPTALLEVKLFPNMRDLDARFVAWKGGAVYAKLESTSEAWISVDDWMGFGVRALKEKIPFIQ